MRLVSTPMRQFGRASSYEWELKGVPLRIEIGRRDLATDAVTIARRDTGEKRQIALPRAAAAIDELLTNIQASLFETARDERERRTLRDPSSYDEMIEYLRRGRRVRLGAVVRRHRVRGARQGRELGDDPVPAARRPAHPVVGMYLLRGVSGGRGRWAQAY